MDGSRKLQDILCDCKLPQARRRSVPVIESLGEIVWLPGYRIAQDWAVAGPESESLIIRVESLPG
jgi:tRNA(Ile)-lysidine synthase